MSVHSAVRLPRPAAAPAAAEWHAGAVGPSSPLAPWSRALALWPTIAALLGVLILWELLTHLLAVPDYLLPGPAAVLARWVRDPVFFFVEGAISLGEALAGLLLGTSVALLAGSLMAYHRWLERSLLPVAIMIKVTPVVVVAPLFVLWFGFSALPRVLIAAMLTFFPVLVGTVTGLRSTPPAAHDVLTTLHASAWDEARELRIPAALPHLFAALKVSTTLALLGAVIAEWVGGDRGLGRAILLANTNLDTTLALAGVFTMAAMGMALVGLLTLLERRVIFWHAAEERD